MSNHEPKIRTCIHRRVAAFAAAVLAATVLPGAASAQSLIDFLWGGSAEFGGSRSVVSFDRKYTPGQIIVSFGDRRLYHVTAPGRATSYPIAVPREQSRWSGTTTVTMKRENPAWTPTAEMIRENPRLPRWVPGGHPMNPLGNRAMYLGSSTYRIHGTDAPWTIGQAVSKGCIRMFNEDAADLYTRVKIGTKVLVTWDRFTTGSSYETAAGDDAPTTSKRASSSGGDPFSGFFGGYTSEANAAEPPPRKTIKYNRKPATGSPSLYYVPGERRADAD